MDPYERLLDPEDPRRCIQIANGKPCLLPKIESSEYCIIHATGAVNIREKKKEMKNYQLSKFRTQLEEKINSDEIKSLREEIALTRFAIEAIVNSCETETDLIIHTAKLSTLIEQTRKLVIDCQKLETQLDRLISKEDLIVVMMEVVQVVSKHISSIDTITAITNDLQILLSPPDSESE